MLGIEQVIFADSMLQVSRQIHSGKIPLGPVTDRDWNFGRGRDD